MNHDTIDMNDTVWIKLDDKGRSIYGHHHSRPLVPNRAGYVKMHLHEVMHIFGEFCFLGSKPPFETEIHLKEPTL
jgi:hypothetical protein